MIPLNPFSKQGNIDAAKLLSVYGFGPFEFWEFEYVTCKNKIKLPFWKRGAV